MEEKYPNPKKTEDNCQSDDSSPTNNALKNYKKKDKSTRSNEFERKLFQDGNVSGKSKSDISQSNVHSEPNYESSAQYCNDKNDDDTVYSTSDFFKPTFQPKNNFEGKALKEELFFSVNQYKNSKASFSKIYRTWLEKRQDTLAKLRSLLKEVHDHAKNYYKTQAMFKELSYNSRCFKEKTEYRTLDFFASLTALVSDAACGITSFTQALELDSYQIKFKEIMDQDAEITKDLYASRSQCVSEYRGIEEVIRKVHPVTLTSTVDQISDTLLLQKLWAAMQNAYEQNNMSKLLDEFSTFFDNACQSDVLQNVGSSIRRFINYNPAALEGCKSTGKAVYGALDAFGEKDGNAAVGYVNKATNLYFMLEDKTEVDHLKNIIHEDTHKSKLESQIEDAIDSFENELKEMEDIYFQLFNSYDSD